MERLDGETEHKVCYNYRLESVDSKDMSTQASLTPAQISAFQKKNSLMPKGLVVFGSLLGLGSIIYYYWRIRSGDTKIAKGDVFFSLEDKESILRELRQSKKNGINRICLEIAKHFNEQYYELVSIARKQRRDVIGLDQKVYEDTIIASHECMMQFFKESINKVLENLEISSEKFQTLCEKLALEDKDFKGPISKLISLMKRMIPAEDTTHRYRAEHLIKLYRYKAKEYVHYQPCNKQYASMLKETAATDRVFEEFSVEEEDYEFRKDCEEKPEVQQAKQLYLETKKQSEDYGS